MPPGAPAAAQAPLPTRAVCAAMGGYSVLGGSLTLVGWLLDVPRLMAWDGSALSMKANPALCASLAGAALLLLALAPRATAWVQALGAVVCGFGGLTLMEHVTGFNLGIDTLFFDEPAGALATTAPGRMGPPAATSFTILGACLMLSVRGPRARRIASALALAPILIAMLGTIGHLYRASQLYAVARVTGIALQTATMIGAVGIGVVLAIPEHGLVATFRRDDAGGEMFRRLLKPIVVVSVTLGALRLAGERAGFYDAAFGTAARTVLELVLFIGLVWWTAERVGRHARDALDAQRALREADRRKDEFLATLAHELRNPLAPLRTSAEIIRKGHADPEAIRRANAIIERQLEHLVHLVDDLLDINRISRGTIELRKQRLDLAAVVERAIETSRPVIDGYGHHLVVAPMEQSITVEGDMTRLTQVVANLLNNAAKYTDPGGKIRVAVEGDGDHAVVRIRDNGVGISPERRPKVFEMFSRTDGSLERTRGGLGIGLALVKQLIEMHGGQVDVNSPPLGPDLDAPLAPPTGSEFFLRLPVVSIAPLAAGRDAEPVVQTLDVVSASRLRVLIADDNVDALESLAMLIEDMGHDTRTAHDGAEALAASAAFRPDVAFLDVGMPKLNGYEVGQRIRAEPWGDKVVLIALTGWGQPDDRRRSTEAGFDQHLVKPATVELIEKALASTR
jgi:signal transduction histidine kinase